MSEPGWWSRELYENVSRAAMRGARTQTSDPGVIAEAGDEWSGRWWLRVTMGCKIEKPEDWAFVSAKGWVKDRRKSNERYEALPEQDHGGRMQWQPDEENWAHPEIRARKIDQGMRALAQAKSYVKQVVAQEPNPENRRLFKLRCARRLKYSDISSRMDVSEDALKTRMFRMMGDLLDQVLNLCMDDPLTHSVLEDILSSESTFRPWLRGLLKSLELSDFEDEQDDF